MINCRPENHTLSKILVKKKKIDLGSETVVQFVQHSAMKWIIAHRSWEFIEVRIAFYVNINRDMYCPLWPLHSHTWTPHTHSMYWTLILLFWLVTFPYTFIVWIHVHLCWLGHMWVHCCVGLVSLAMTHRDNVYLLRHVVCSTWHIGSMTCTSIIMIFHNHLFYI